MDSLGIVALPLTEDVGVQRLEFGKVTVVILPILELFHRAIGNFGITKLLPSGPDPSFGQETVAREVD